MAASAARRAVAGMARRAARSAARARLRSSGVATGRVKLTTAVPRKSMYPAWLPLSVPLLLRLAPLLLSSLLILGRPALAGAEVDANASPDASEQALLDVRDAVLRRDETAARLHALRVDASHPLAAYPEFWRLRMLLDDRMQIPDPDALDAEIEDFLARYPDTAVADRLRAEWLVNLGRRSIWHRFDAHFPLVTARRDSSLWCLAGVSRLLRGLPAGPEALRAWNERRELGEDCELLTLRMYEAGQLDTEQLDRRLRSALEDKATDTIRVLGRLLGIGADDLGLVIDSPSRALARSRDPRVVLIALGLLARPSAEQAAARLAERNDIPEADRRLLWAIIGASAARDLDTRAWQWARQGLGARAGRDTREWLVRAAMLADDWPGVLLALDHLDETDAQTPRWTYWRARALARTDAADAAGALLALVAGRNGYYPMLAAEEAGLAQGPPGPQAEPQPPVDPASLVARPPIARALALYRLGLRGDAQGEWLAGLRGAGDAELLAAARLACSRGILDRCINEASRMREHDDWSLRYLRPYREELESAARAHDLDPAWVYGLIRQESRFTPVARSAVGARGLMQIMPATGRWIARRRGIGPFRPASLEDPGTNLDFGTWYMRHVLDRLDGSILLASAGYNAGPGRPARWRGLVGRPVDGALFAELIPFNETRNYVQNVIANTAAYAALLRGEPLRLRPLLGTVAPAGASTRPGEDEPQPAPGPLDEIARR